MFFLDLAGYTRLTEEQGDAAAADLAETLAVLVVLVRPRARRRPGEVAGRRGHGPLPGAGRSGPVGAQLVAQLPEAGLPLAHVGIAAGRWWSRAATTSTATVNLAARIAAHASAGQVVVSQSVAESVPPQGGGCGSLGTAAQGWPVRFGC